MKKNLREIFQSIVALFSEAGIEVPAPEQRTIAGRELSALVQKQLDEMNSAAYKMDMQTGGMYLDWEQYLSPMDIYYDNDGSLFVLCSRMGKLYRIPVTVSEDGTAVTLGELAEIPLTGRTNNSTVRVFRTAEGKARWFITAASAVLNRVNEIDSTELFDNFISRAQGSETYPILSFYHMPEVIRLGQADWLARDGYLYLASGTFSETEDAQRVASRMEQRVEGSEEWGASIGYLTIGQPELLEVANGVTVPVFRDGINTEISVVLERDAANLFTRASAEEVTRGMRKQEYEAMVLMFGEARAKELAQQVDGTNRAITESDAIRRTEPSAVAPATPVAAAIAPAAESPVASAVAAQAPDAEHEPQTFEVTDEVIEALTASVAAVFQPALDSVSASLAALEPRMATMEATARTASEQLEARLAAVEATDEEKQRQWRADLPTPRPNTVIVRPSKTRAEPSEANKQPDLAAVAAATTAGMSTRPLNVATK